MTLTIGHGPLAGKARETVNYRIEGPAHRLFFEPFPRRVRATFGGMVVIDSDQAMLLHETGLLPQLYVPWEHVAAVVKPTDHHTHCPFKGDASYWSIAVGDRTAENAIWSYPEPIQESGWLLGYAAAYWDKLDAWYDEDEQVRGHIRDPYHRIDVRRMSRAVKVTLDGHLVAESDRALVLSETGLPNRYYIHPGDVRTELFKSSDTQTHCPYKGDASYLTLHLQDRELEDAAWLYSEPYDGVSAIRDHICFYDEKGFDVQLDPAEG
ncbi:DUF427 domain-containing protein [Flindersiella endophytica]